MRTGLRNIFFLVGMAVSFLGCGKRIETLKEFNTFLSMPENGFKVTKSVNGVLITVIYMPPEYVALKEMESSGKIAQRSYDSLLRQNSASLSFIMILGPDESKNNKDDIMYKDLKDFKEYITRTMDLNFELENKVELITENNSFHPVLSSLENTYGLTKDRKINFVFTPSKEKHELENVKHFDFVYTDEMFDIGILHFEFDNSDLKNKLPEIKFQN
jgi:hypothetical protein